MCGIAGIVWKQTTTKRRKLLESVIPLISSRGPDESGIYIDNNVGLVHTRLSIIDHDGGKQPFCLGPDQPILIFNGEIFNYQNLRTILEQQGVVFTTNSDTEVLYVLLCKYGEKAVRELNGQFAFCFFNPKTGILLLARDQFGEKPLFYSEHSGFVFASEIKALTALTERDATLCPDAMNAMTSFWAPAPNKTVWQGIKAIPPGYILKVESGDLWLETYMHDPRVTESLNPSNEQVRDQFGQAVCKRMIGDVPIGLFLSGGLDSSLVGYEVAQRTSKNLKSYSVGFENQDFDERSQQKEISNFLGTNHQTLLINDKILIDNFEIALLAAESPTPRSAFVPMYLLCKEVNQDSLKVILTGEGADEIFLGYDLFREIMVKQAIRCGAELQSVLPMLETLNTFIPSQKNYQKFLALKYSNYKKLSENCGIFSSHSERKNLGTIARLFFKSDENDRCWEEYLNEKYRTFQSMSELDRGRIIEIESLLSGHLLSTQGDRMSMANSVETRTPFLDKDFVNFAQKIAHESHYDRYYGEKAVLKKAYEGRIPDGILNRQKFPYRAPDSFCFANTYGRSYVLDRLQNIESNIFDVNYFRNFCEMLLCKNKISPRENHAFMVVFSGIIIEHIFKEFSVNNQFIASDRKSVSTSFGEIIFYGINSVALHHDT